MVSVFEKLLESDFVDLENVLYFMYGFYYNLYDLMMFYDNYDMVCINVMDNGFINVYNWLFMVRGIFVVYMGFEIGFMCGIVEYVGNCNYVG